MNGNEQYVFKTCTVQMKIAFKMKVEDNHFMHNCYCRGVVVIAAAQLHPTKPELRFCAGSSPACGVSEIRDGEHLWQWSQLEIRLNTFCQLTIPQNNSIHH